jgi:hypothetical protein
MSEIGVLLFKHLFKRTDQLKAMRINFYPHMVLHAMYKSILGYICCFVEPPLSHHWRD